VVVTETADVLIVMSDELKDLCLVMDKPSIPENLKDLLNASKSAKTKKVETNSEDRMKNLVVWLEKNRLPVTFEQQNSVINILNTVFIRPPYEADDCESLNELILDKIRQLVLDFDKQNKQA